MSSEWKKCRGSEGGGLAVFHLFPLIHSGTRTENGEAYRLQRLLTTGLCMLILTVGKDMPTGEIVAQILWK